MILHNDQGQRVTLKTNTGDPNMAQADNAVRIEQNRLAAWQNLTDVERHMVQAVVRSTLRRLLEDPGWIPASTHLGRGRLDVSFVVELDTDMVDAAAAARDLDLEIAFARQSLAGLPDLLRDDDEPTPEARTP